MIKSSPRKIPHLKVNLEHSVDYFMYMYLYVYLEAKSCFIAIPICFALLYNLFGNVVVCIHIVLF